MALRTSVDPMKVWTDALDSRWGYYSSENPYYGEQQSYVMIYEQWFASYCSSSRDNSYKEFAIYGPISFEVKEYVTRNDTGNSSFQVDPVIRGEPSDRSLCHEGWGPSANLCFSIFLFIGSGFQCHKYKFECLDIDFSFPSDKNARECDSQTDCISGFSLCISPKVGKISLVEEKIQMCHSSCEIPRSFLESHSLHQNFLFWNLHIWIFSDDL